MKEAPKGASTLGDHHLLLTTILRAWCWLSGLPVRWISVLRREATRAILRSRPGHLASPRSVARVEGVSMHATLSAWAMCWCADYRNERIFCPQPLKSPKSCNRLSWCRPVGRGLQTRVGGRPLARHESRYLVERGCLGTQSLAQSHCGRPLVGVSP